MNAIIIKCIFCVFIKQNCILYLFKKLNLFAFQVKFNEPVILKPGKTATIAFLTFKPSIPDLQLTSYLRLHTNISHIDIPLLCFTGHLKVVRNASNYWTCFS